MIWFKVVNTKGPVVSYRWIREPTKDMAKVWRTFCWIKLALDGEMPLRSEWKVEPATFWCGKDWSY